MTGKLDIECVSFRPLLKNTLRGFAVIRIPELHLIINDVAIHQKGKAHWAQLPAKPMLKDGQAVIDPETGKTKYVSMIASDHVGTRNAFSQRVAAAVIEHAGPQALEAAS
jgi:hypothetical protein